MERVKHLIGLVRASASLIAVGFFLRRGLGLFRPAFLVRFGLPGLFLSRLGLPTACLSLACRPLLGLPAAAFSFSCLLRLGEPGADLPF